MVDIYRSSLCTLLSLALSLVRPRPRHQVLLSLCFTVEVTDTFRLSQSYILSEGISNRLRSTVQALSTPASSKCDEEKKNHLMVCLSENYAQGMVLRGYMQSLLRGSRISPFTEGPATWHCSSSQSLSKTSPRNDQWWPTDLFQSIPQSTSTAVLCVQQLGWAL